MKRRIPCECGSGKYYDSCCSPPTEVWFRPMEGPEEYEEMLNKLIVSRKFNMRFRGLRQFYGDELIAYKLKNPSSSSRNIFLEIIAEYFTTYLEDKCPSSWNECDHEFWEEFFYSFYPSTIKISPKQNEVKRFLNEVKKFVHWLDKHIGTSFYSYIEELCAEATSELLECEKLINKLYLHTFPNIHKRDFDIIAELDAHEQNYNFVDDKVAIFEVQDKNGPITIARAHDDKSNYQILGLPIEIITPGMIICGFIGKEESSWLWTWDHPICVFPRKAKKFLEHVLI